MVMTMRLVVRTVLCLLYIRVAQFVRWLWDKVELTMELVSGWVL